MSTSPVDQKDVKPVTATTPIKNKVGRRDLSYLMEHSDDSDFFSSGLTQLKRLIECSAGLKQGVPALKWTTQSRIQLAKLYQMHPELWCPTHPDYIEPYSNGSVAKRGLKIAAIREQLGGPYTHGQIRMEINAIRTRYKNYLIEMLKNKVNGYQVQLPKWPVFEHLKFLTNTVLNDEDNKKVNSAKTEKRKRLSSTKNSGPDSPGSTLSLKRLRERSKEDSSHRLQPTSTPKTKLEDAQIACEPKAESSPSKKCEKEESHEVECVSASQFEGTVPELQQSETIEQEASICAPPPTANEPNCDVLEENWLQEAKMFEKEQNESQENESQENESIKRFSEFVVAAFKRIGRRYPERIVDLSQCIIEIMHKVGTEDFGGCEMEFDLY